MKLCEIFFGLFAGGSQKSCPDTLDLKSLFMNAGGMNSRKDSGSRAPGRDPRSGNRSGDRSNQRNSSPRPRLKLDLPVSLFTLDPAGVKKLLASDARAFAAIFASSDKTHADRLNNRRVLHETARSLTGLVYSCAETNELDDLPAPVAVSYCMLMARLLNLGQQKQATMAVARFLSYDVSEVSKVGELRALAKFMEALIGYYSDQQLHSRNESNRSEGSRSSKKGSGDKFKPNLKSSESSANDDYEMEMARRI